MDRASEVFSFCGKLDINVQKKTYNLEQLLAQLILDIAYATAICFARFANGAIWYALYFALSPRMHHRPCG